MKANKFLCAAQYSSNFWLSPGLRDRKQPCKLPSVVCVWLLFVSWGGKWLSQSQGATGTAVGIVLAPLQSFGTSDACNNVQHDAA